MPSPDSRQIFRNIRVTVKGGARESLGEARNRRPADIVALRQFLQRRALRASPDGLFLLGRRGTAHVLSLGLGAAPAFGGAGADQIALHVGEASEDGEHQAPGAGAGVGPRFRQGSKLRLGVRDALDDGEEIEGAASEAVDPCHRHHVAGGELAEHPVTLAPVGSCARHLFPVDVPAGASGLAKLLKLAVEGLPVGADAGIAEEPFFGVSFVHILCKP
jgi:hypothetical protein